jgi:ornithine cyclodeaminase/alanine dehydrogenase
MPTLLLTQSEVRSLLDMSRAMAAVEQAFVAHAGGKTQMPPKVYLDFPQHDGDLRAMPAWMEGAAGVKWVNSHAHNADRFGLPSVMGLYVLSDPRTALPLAVLDATLLTAYRTGAAAAVASKHLRPDAETLGIIGCGVQADFLIEAHRVLRPGIRVRCADRDPAAAQRVAAQWGGEVTSTEVAAGSDIVCTATPVRSPIVRAAWIRPGTHINAMGADAEGKQELDTAVLQRARVFVDDWPQASHSGEINVPLHSGALGPDDIAGSVCAVVAGTGVGREHPDQITLFDSTGLAIQDLALARALYQRAAESGVGTQIDFLG